MTKIDQAILGDPTTGFSHTWLIGVEEQFYLLWPELFLLMAADRQRMTRMLGVAHRFPRAAEPLNLLCA